MSKPADDQVALGLLAEGGLRRVAPGVAHYFAAIVGVDAEGAAPGAGARVALGLVAGVVGVRELGAVDDVQIPLDDVLEDGRRWLAPARIRDEDHHVAVVAVVAGVAD